MSTMALETKSLSKTKKLWFTALIVLAIITFSACFVLVDNIYFKFADARFPNVGTSAWLATLWG